MEQEGIGALDSVGDVEEELDEQTALQCVSFNVNVLDVLDQLFLLHEYVRVEYLQRPLSFLGVVDLEQRLGIISGHDKRIQVHLDNI